MHPRLGLSPILTFNRHMSTTELILLAALCTILNRPFRHMHAGKYIYIYMYTRTHAYTNTSSHTRTWTYIYIYKTRWDSASSGCSTPLWNTQVFVPKTRMVMKNKACLFHCPASKQDALKRHSVSRACIVASVNALQDVLARATSWIALCTDLKKFRKSCQNLQSSTSWTAQVWI